ncbi:MAG: LysR family transcriptional regulator [Pseudomonadota bacterium]
MNQFAPPPPSASLDIDVLRSVIAIAETGALTHAAARVGRTPAALSMQLKKLEETLGAKLFERGRAGMVTTEAGDRLLPHARRMVALQREALDAFRMPALSGTVRLGAIDDYAGSRLAEVLADFSRACPDVTVSTMIGSSAMLVPMLERGEIDLGLITPGGAADWLPGDRVVHEEPLVWAACEGGDAWTRTPVPLALATPGCPWRRVSMEALDQLTVPYRIAYQSDFLVPQRAAVMADLAVAPLPRSTLLPGMRALRPSEGFGTLGITRIALRLAPEAAVPGSAVEALAERIAERGCVAV